MTCIVGIRTAKGCLLGGDTLAANGWTGMNRSDPKVFNLCPHIAIGYTSSFRMGQILRYHVSVDPPLTELRQDDAFEWAVKTLIPAARHAFKDQGWSMTDAGGAELGGFFLLAVRDRLLQIQNDFQVSEPVAAFDACGSGEVVALGALAALLPKEGLPQKVAAEKAATQALEIAERFTPTVRGPFTMVWTKP